MKNKNVLFIESDEFEDIIHHYIENGKIAEQGTHDALIAKEGRYYNLFTYQARIEGRLLSRLDLRFEKFDDVSFVFPREVLSKFSNPCSLFDIRYLLIISYFFL